MEPMGKNHYANARFPLHKATAPVGVVVSEEQGGCGGDARIEGPPAPQHRAGVGMELITENGVKSPRRRGGRKEKCTWDFLEGNTEAEAGLLKQQCHLPRTPPRQRAGFRAVSCSAVSPRAPRVALS